VPFSPEDNFLKILENEKKKKKKKKTNTYSFWLIFMNTNTCEYQGCIHFEI